MIIHNIFLILFEKRSLIKYAGAYPFKTQVTVLLKIKVSVKNPAKTEI